LNVAQIPAFLLALREPRRREVRDELTPARLAQALVALGMRRANAFHFHGAVPVAGRGDGAVVGAEADQKCSVGEGGPGQLADVQLAARAHFGGRGVADV
jgi:hypothetical protein